VSKDTRSLITKKSHAYFKALPWPLAGQSEEKHETIRTATNLLEIKIQYAIDICKMLHYNNLLDTLTIWKHKEIE
jgi:hypothetical protein